MFFAFKFAQINKYRAGERTEIDIYELYVWVIDGVIGSAERNESADSMNFSVVLTLNPFSLYTDRRNGV